MSGSIYGLLLLYAVGLTHSLQCLSYDGSPVDWFIVYKIPTIPNGGPLISSGTGFFYMDQTYPELVLSTVGIDDTSHALYNTLDQIYHNQTTIAFMMYNDQAPDTTSQYHGHTKGVVAFDKEGGFWLVHSTPKFPPYHRHGYYWDNVKNGQSFLCLSVAYNDMDNIGKIMMYTYPLIYDSFMPAVYASHNPTLAAIITKASSGSRQPHVKNQPWFQRSKLSVWSETFIVFAKYTEFGRDLYDGLMAEDLQEDLLVQSWLESARTPEDKLPSNCSIPNKVYNVENIAFPGTSIKFHTSKDHSKWAVSKDGGNWLCIGDINRQVPQFHRAGGQVCLQNRDAWQSYRNLISEFEKCSTDIINVK